MNKEDVVYIYNGILLSHLKKDELLAFVRPWMDLAGIMLIKSGGEGQIPYDFIHMWNIKI